MKQVLKLFGGQMEQNAVVGADGGNQFVGQCIAPVFGEALPAGEGQGDAGLHAVGQHAVGGAQQTV